VVRVLAKGAHLRMSMPLLQMSAILLWLALGRQVSISQRTHD
jgi:hypothetical protein